MDNKTCSKCGSKMQEDKDLRALNSEVELVSEHGFRGDKLKAFYCESCGYLELYRKKK